ncbi:GNAT family protein [Proteiniborus sp.]|uniref:GNAT family N-acetyltransferase n=1 Tax=Proteiniborus sp. TaxID=2079015 RepID=UPI00331A43B0
MDKHIKENESGVESSLFNNTYVYIYCKKKKEMKITIMGFVIKEMTDKEVKEICTWKYDDIYSFYNLDESSYEGFLNGSYYSVYDEHKNLVGFCCFGQSATVPNGKLVGAYDEAGFIDIGLGMMPVLCGKGLGDEFLKKCMEFVEEKNNISKFRLTVATFNKRAMKVYEKLGFKRDKYFDRVTQDGRTIEFVTMKFEKE